MARKKFQLKTPKPIRKAQRKYRNFFGNPIVKLILLPLRIIVGVANWILRIMNTFKFVGEVLILGKNKPRKNRSKR